MEYLKSIQLDNTKNINYAQSTLINTIAHNKCNKISITSRDGIENRKERIGIVILARQHPGETMASYVMQGVIDFLISDHEKAQYLRNHVVFKIIPMLNPDGVIHGHYRTSLSGADLNRRWKKINKVFFVVVIWLICVEALSNTLCCEEDD